jgi:hypothetical protein
LPSHGFLSSRYLESLRFHLGHLQLGINWCRQQTVLLLIVYLSHTVSEHKHLGLVISDNWRWEKHIDMITEKANKRINILRKFKFISSFGSFTIRYKLVSSANSFIVDCISVTLSFIKII